MARAIEIRGERGTFLVETDVDVSLPPRPGAPASGGSEAPGAGRLPTGMRPVSSVGHVSREFSEVRDLVVECCNGLNDAIGRIRNPDRVAVEFGVKFAGEAGVPMLTKASGEATLKISIEWKAVPAGGNAP